MLKTKQSALDDPSSLALPSVFLGHHQQQQQQQNEHRRVARPPHSLSLSLSLSRSGKPTSWTRAPAYCLCVSLSFNCKQEMTAASAARRGAAWPTEPAENNPFRLEKDRKMERKKHRDPPCRPSSVVFRLEFFFNWSAGSCLMRMSKLCGLALRLSVSLSLSVSTTFNLSSQRQTNKTNDFLLLLLLLLLRFFAIFVYFLTLLYWLDDGDAQATCW